MQREPLTRVQRLIREQPWAMLEPAFEAMVEVVDRWAAGVSLSAEDLEAIAAARRLPPSTAAPGAVAVIPVHGVISHRVNMLAEISGGTSTERLGAAIRAALEDRSIDSLVLDVDSPGGSVHGVEELADEIFAARGRKPIVAAVNATAASAAYWLASQADELVVTPSGEVGSIGVFTFHDNLRAMAEKVGVERTYIHAGKFKVEGHPFAPLPDEARAHLQARVDEVHDVFVKHVARGRKTSQARVREEFGQGRMVAASRAVALGMADREETLQQVLDRLSGRAAKAAGTRAEETAPELAAAAPESGPAPAAEADRERLRLATALAARR